TLGATVGVLLTPFVLVANFGHPASAAMLGGIGAIAAALAWRAQSPTSSPAAMTSPRADEAVAPIEDRGWLLLTASLTGALGLALDYLGFRVFGQIFSGTVYTFALILAVHLVFTSLGAAIYARWAPTQLAGPAHARGVAALAFGIG